MTTLLHEAYTALLAGLTHRTGNEIHWHNKYGKSITVEPVDVESESYIIRYYYGDGGLFMEIHYLHDQRHGKDVGWYDGGQNGGNSNIITEKHMARILVGIRMEK